MGRRYGAAKLRTPARAAGSAGMTSGLPIFAVHNPLAMNEPWILLIAALLPALLVFLTAFYLIRQLAGDLRGELRNELTAARGREQKQDDHRHTLPLRLQAYERLTLFLERITPGPLVLRVHKRNMTAEMLHRELLATIREEFDHNVTQQIYVSDGVWQRVRQAKEETVRLVNLAYEQAGDQASGTAYSQRVFELAAGLKHMPSQVALFAIREEVRRLF